MLYKIKVPQIAHETIDGETFIINTLSGLYYTAEGYASIIWNAIASGYSFDQIKNAFDKSNVFDSNDAVIGNFFALLLVENLLIEVDDGHENTITLHINKNINFQLPTLSKYDDLQELVALDPIHDVSEQKGWPFQKENA